MKLGCIFKLLAVFIILIGIGYYVADKYSDEILAFGKNKVDQFIEEKIERELDEIKSKELIDSLKVSVTNYFKEKDYSQIKEELPNLIEKIKVELNTDAIDSLNFTEIKNKIFDNE